MRLDHLLSKECFSTEGRHSNGPARDTPVGALVGCRPPTSRVAGIRSLLSGNVAGGYRLLFRFEGAGSTTRVDRLAFDAAASSAHERSACVTSHLENCRASTSILFSTELVSGENELVRKNDRKEFQATKSQRWMPWRQEPMKDVSDCEKLRGAVD